MKRVAADGMNVEDHGEAARILFRRPSGQAASIRAACPFRFKGFAFAGGRIWNGKER